MIGELISHPVKTLRAPGARTVRPTRASTRGGGRRHPHQPARRAEHRREPRGGVAFGAEFSVLRPGTLTVGDALTVLAWTGSELDEPRPG
ncbi:hypothetical protein [Actinoallomurus sp. CA-142502]|uniref:hypothetical protein n=1 Tax=Actinoallomurus sp. CA-142502 TaxID=3239885 RepID=UPI003D907CBB